MAEQQAKRVLMLVYNDAQNDARVWRAATWAATADYDVTVVGAARTAGLPTREQRAGVTFLTAPVLTGLSIPSILNALWALFRSDLGTMTPAPPAQASSLRTLLTIILLNLWALRLTWHKRYDLVHCHDVWPVPAALFITARSLARFIYDSHENMPDVFEGGPGKQLVRWGDHAALKRADTALTVGERLADALRERGAKTVVVVGNWRNPDEFAFDAHKLESERQRLGLAQYTFVISYLGLLMKERDVEPLLEAVARNPDVGLLISGRGALQSIVEQYATQYDNIHWLGWVNLTEVALYTRLSDVVYRSINADYVGQAYYMAPNKLFEAFTAGCALIGRRGAGEMAAILERFPAAILLDDVTAETLTAGFDRLRDTEQLKAFKAQALAASQHYNWDVAQARLSEVYTRLLQ